YRFLFLYAASPPQLYPLSLHDALPILTGRLVVRVRGVEHAGAVDSRGSGLHRSAHPITSGREQQSRDCQRPSFNLCRVQHGTVSAIGRGASAAKAVRARNVTTDGALPALPAAPA